MANFTSTIIVNTKGVNESVRDLNKLDKTLVETGSEIKAFNSDATIKVVAPKPPNMKPLLDSYKGVSDTIIKTNKDISEGFDIQGTTDFIAKVGASYVGLSEVIQLSNENSAESTLALERATRALVIANALKDTGEVAGIALTKARSAAQKVLNAETLANIGYVKGAGVAQNAYNIIANAGSKAVNGLKFSQNGLKAALGIGVITAVIGGLTTLIESFGGLNEVISNVTASFKGFISGAGQFFSSIGKFITGDLKGAFDGLSKISEVAGKAFDQSKNIDKATTALTKYEKDVDKLKVGLAKLEAASNNVYLSEEQRLQSALQLTNENIKITQGYIDKLKELEKAGDVSKIKERLEKESELISLQNTALTQQATIADNLFNKKQKELDSDKKLLDLRNKIKIAQAEGKNTLELEIKEKERDIQLTTQAIINAKENKLLTEDRRKEIILENTEKLNGLILDKQSLQLSKEKLDQQAAQTIINEGFTQKQNSLNNEIERENLLLEEQNNTVERALKYLDRKKVSENSITDIIKNSNIERKKSEIIANNELDKINKVYKGQLQLISLEREKIKEKEKQNKSDLEKGLITQSQFDAAQKQLETLEKNLNEKQLNLDIKLGIDTTEVEKQLENSNLETLINQQISTISFKSTGETLGKQLLEGIGESLSLSDEILGAQVDRTSDELSNIFNQSIELYNALGDLEHARIDNRLEQLSNTKEVIQEEIDSLNEEINTLKDDIKQTNILFQDSVGARRDFLNEQLDQQNELLIEKNTELQNEKDNLKRIGEEEEALNKKKEKIIKNQMILEADIQSLKAAGALAAAIFDAAQATRTVAQTALDAAGAAAKAAQQSGVGAVISVPAVLGIVAAGIGAAIALAGSIKARVGKLEDGGIIGVDEKYANGGLLEGPSHANGGIRGTGRFNNIEVEGGEFVVNKRATKKYAPVLQAINSFKFANGGLLQPDTTIDELIPTNTDQNLKVSVVDIIAGINRVNVIDQNSFI